MAGIKLYDIPMEFAVLEQALVESEGELSPELEAQFDAFIKGGKDKMEAAAMVVRTLESEADMCWAQAQALINGEVKRLAARKDSHQKNADRLKALVLRALDSAFDGKLKTPLFTIWGQTSAATISIDLAPDSRLEDVERSAPEFVRRKLELNKDAIKSAAKEGKPICDELIVSEVPGTRFLRIK